MAIFLNVALGLWGLGPLGSVFVYSPVRQGLDVADYSGRRSGLALGGVAARRRPSGTRATISAWAVLLPLPITSMLSPAPVSRGCTARGAQCFEMAS